MKKQIKKVIAILLCLVMAIPVTALFASAENTAPAVWDGTVAEDFEAGTGTAEDPYQITSGSHLALMAKYVNSLEEEWTLGGLYFKLMNDIDLANKPFAPIGGRDDTYAFEGYFDGNGKTISNVYICAMDEYQGETFEAYFKNAGIFGLTRNSVIRDLTVAGDFKATTNWNVGGIVGRAQDTEIINCHVICDELDFIAEDNSLTTLYFGGIVGYAYGNTPVYDCTVKSDIKLTGRGNSSSDRTNLVGGGIVGHFNIQGAATEEYQNIIENCYYKGKIYCESDMWVPWIGGLYAIEGNITGGSYTTAGFCKVLITNCVADVVFDFSKAKFKAGGDNNFGGVSSTMNRSANKLTDVHTKVEYIGFSAAEHPEVPADKYEGYFTKRLTGITRNGHNESVYVNVTTNCEYMTGNSASTTGSYIYEWGWKGQWDTATCKTGVSDITLYVANVEAAITANAGREDNYNTDIFDIDDPFDDKENVIDYTALEAAIAEAKAIDTTKYTSLTVQTLNTAIAAGEAMVADGAQKQADVDELVADIENAIEGLKEDTTNNEDPEDPEDPENPEQPGENNNTTGGDTTTEEKKGCGSSITLAGVAMIAAFGAAAVAVAKKKED